MTQQRPVCIVCENSDDQVPLITLTYQGSQFSICPQHLPILIHKPGQLGGKLPGAENLKPTEGH